MRPIVRKHAWGIIALAALGLLFPDAALAGKQLVRMRLDGPVLESPRQEMDLAVLFGGEKARTLRDWVTMIEKATDDSEVNGLVVIIEQPEINFAQVEELTRALRDFRAKGKKVYCYLDYAGNATYTLATAADHITLAEYSLLGTAGLYAELSFYKGLFDKIGVEADMMHCGDYKAALEPFTRTEPSKEFAENINWLLDGIYERMVALIAEGRKLDQGAVMAAIDAAPLNAQEALKRKLVDAVAPFPEFKQMIRKEFGKDVEVVQDYGKDEGLKLDFDNPFAIFQMFKNAFEKAAETEQPGIALIYIEGGINVGKNDFGLMGATAGSTTIRGAFEKAREDDNIKAVVVRVDSPGGSALASDIMWDAATRCGKEKPVIVSMGSVAGSGGYYVSIPGDTIFAEETTITGSIGVVGGKFVWDNLMVNKLGITTTEFSRGKNADLFSLNRRWNEEERVVMTRFLNEVYDQFKSRIKASRGDRIKGDLEPLAGGRVYTGRQALDRGLVDKLGGLSDAINFAAKKVGLTEYEIYVLPPPRDLVQVFRELFGEEKEDEFEISTTSWFGDPLLRAAAPLLGELAPQQAGRILRGLWNAAVLNREHVGVFMPFDLRTR